MNYSLFLDDLRKPPTEVPVGKKWIIARNYQKAVAIVEKNGMPTFVSFDHDLGRRKAPTGYDFAKYLVECDQDGKKFPDNFDYLIHSANCVGGPNIALYLKNYFEFKQHSELKDSVELENKPKLKLLKL